MDAVVLSRRRTPPRMDPAVDPASREALPVRMTLLRALLRVAGRIMMGIAAGGGAVAAAGAERSSPVASELAIALQVGTISGCSVRSAVQGTRYYCPVRCGGPNQMACQWYTFSLVGGSIAGRKFCGFDGIENSLLLLNDVERCVIDTRRWTSFALDMTRVNDPGSDSRYANCGGSAQKSCWSIDDVIRDQLTLDAAQLGFTTTLEGGTQLKDGRYIYVYRARDDAFIVRRYDRKKDGVNPSCEAYAQYESPANRRVDPQGNRIYLHVRHSQLVGSETDRVWAAGELRVTNGLIDRINNASGHYRPPATAVRQAMTKLRLEEIPRAPKISSGDRSQVSAAEAECPAPVDDPGVDEDDDQAGHDEL